MTVASPGLPLQAELRYVASSRSFVQHFCQSPCILCIPQTFASVKALVCSNRSKTNSRSYLFRSVVGSKPDVGRIVVCIMLCVALAACKSVTAPPTLPVLPAQEELKSTRLIYPILLLHGLGQKSHAWEGPALNFYEREMGLGFGGVLSMRNGAVECSGARGTTRDFYTVSFSNSHDSVSNWGRELEAYIRLVLSQTKASKVILIGYSMGGVASRYYLTHHVHDHHVKRLITIGSPHLGSPFARIYKVKSALTGALAKDPNIVSATALKAALSAVNACESDLPFDAPAVHDLMRPEDGGQFLDELGKSEHPRDVEYVSVTGEVDVASEASKLSAGAVQEVLRRALEFFDTGVGAWFSSGDGVVSLQSQNITNIPWFKNSPDHQRLTRSVSLKSVHTEHLQNSNEIQRVTLEDKPEFKSAEFRTLNNKPCLVVQYSDLLSPEKSSVSIRYPAMAGERNQKLNNAKLIRLENSEVVQQVVFELGDVDFSKNFIVDCTISNFFGNTASTVKQWIAP